MSLDLDALAAAVAAHGSVGRVLVARAAGSAPREAGAAMLVWDGGMAGTIGGGALEFAACHTAQDMLAGGPSRRMRAMALGPALGQCCGGSVTLVWEKFDAGSLPVTLPHIRTVDAEAAGEGPVPPRITARAAMRGPGSAPLMIDGWLIENAPQARRALWVFGAGHVGRAIVATLAPLPDFAITWIDTAPDRFPATLPEGVAQVVAADPARLALHAPPEAEHLVLTYAHDMDLAICHALLSRGFAGAGLIGSATKWARFRARLAALGHAPQDIARIACPIGDPDLGKHPQAIALGVAMALLQGQPARAARAG